MKNTFVKIALLVLAISGAVVSIFVFSGTRILNGVDVSNIEIQDSIFVNDIQSQINRIGPEWKTDFDKIDDLIGVYYNNKLLSRDDEQLSKTSLVDTAASKLTTFALNSYFLKSSWDRDDISSIKTNSTILLDYKSAGEVKVAQGDTKTRLELVEQTCQHYFEADTLSLKYTTNTTAKSTIKKAKELCSDSYLMHEATIRTKLNNADRKIHDSHKELIIKKVEELSEYTVDWLSNISDFSVVRSKVVEIRTLITNYKNADFYPEGVKNMNAIGGMIDDVNDIIDEWNTEINSNKEEIEYDPYSPYTPRTKQVRKYPNENEIANLKRDI